MSNNYSEEFAGLKNSSKEFGKNIGSLVSKFTNDISQKIDEKISSSDVYELPEVKLSEVDDESESLPIGISSINNEPSVVSLDLRSNVVLIDTLNRIQYLLEGHTKNFSSDWEFADVVGSSNISLNAVNKVLEDLGAIDITHGEKPLKKTLVFIRDFSSILKDYILLERIKLLAKLSSAYSVYLLFSVDSFNEFDSVEFDTPVAIASNGETGILREAFKTDLEFKLLKEEA
jgi:hypothetical protein